MRQFASAAIALFLISAPLTAMAAPTPQYCLSLRKHFDACEAGQIKKHKPVQPTCSRYTIEMKKAGC